MLIRNIRAKSKFKISALVRDAIFILIGITSAGFGLKGFLLPNNFIDGGVTGISLIAAEKTDISLSILIVAINLPFLILGLSQIGKQFAIKSLLAIVGLALVIYLVPFEMVTDSLGFHRERAGPTRAGELAIPRNRRRIFKACPDSVDVFVGATFRRCETASGKHPLSP